MYLNTTGFVKLITTSELLKTRAWVPQAFPVWVTFRYNKYEAHGIDVLYGYLAKKRFNNKNTTATQVHRSYTKLLVLISLFNIHTFYFILHGRNFEGVPFKFTVSSFTNHCFIKLSFLRLPLYYRAWGSVYVALIDTNKTGDSLDSCLTSKIRSFGRKTKSFPFRQSQFRDGLI